MNSHFGRREITGPAADASSSFVLEDEKKTQALKALLSTIIVLDLRRSDTPCIVGVTQGFQELTRYKKDRLLATHLHVLHKAARSSEPSIIELERRDRSSFQASVTSAFVLDSRGQPIMSLLHLREQLSSASEKDAAAPNRPGMEALCGFFILDSLGRFTECSPGFQKMTLYSGNDLCGESCLALFGLESDADTIKDLRACQQQRAPYCATLLCYKKDRSPFWALWWSLPLSQLGGADLASEIPDRSEEIICLIVNATAKEKRVAGFVIGKQLGRGAFGIVRLGRHIESGVRVAVKEIDASRFRSIGAIEQVQVEISVLSSLKHPNIIALQSMHFVANTFYFVMDVASGGSLADYTAQQPNRRLTEEAAHRIFLSITDALDYCHRRGIIHRDLKPENILLDLDGNAKVADFGLAAMTSPLSSTLRTSCGTPGFSAPEVLKGQAYGPGADLWSLGVILYELLQGRLPWRASSQAELIELVSKGEISPLSSASAQCKDLVAALLTVEPGQRITMERIRRHPWLTSLGKERSKYLGTCASLEAGSRMNSLEASSRSVSLDTCSPSTSLEAEGASLAAMLGQNKDTQVASSKHARSSLHLQLPGTWAGDEGTEGNAAAQAQHSADELLINAREGPAGMRMLHAKSSPSLSAITAKVRISAPDVPVVARLDAGSLLKPRTGRPMRRQSLASTIGPPAMQGMLGDTDLLARTAPPSSSAKIAPNGVRAHAERRASEMLHSKSTPVLIPDGVKKSSLQQMAVDASFPSAAGQSKGKGSTADKRG